MAVPLQLRNRLQALVLLHSRAIFRRHIEESRLAIQTKLGWQFYPRSRTAASNSPAWMSKCPVSDDNARACVGKHRGVAQSGAPGRDS